MFLNVTVNKRERDIHVVKRAQACDANQMLLPSLYTSITDPDTSARLVAALALGACDRPVAELSDSFARTPAKPDVYATTCRRLNSEYWFLGTD